MDYTQTQTRAGFVLRWLEATAFNLIGMNRRSAEIYRHLLSQRRCASCARSYAALAMRAGRPVEAERALLKLTEWHPEDTHGWFVLGQARMAAGFHAAAVAAFQQAVRLDPDHEDAWLSLGQAHIALRQFAYAILPLRHAQALAPLSSLPPYLIGLCQHHCGNEAGLRAALARLLEIDPQRAQSLLEEAGAGHGRLEKVLF